MKKNLLNLLSLNQQFTESEQPLKYKIIYLNGVFLLATVIAFGMGFYRWRLNPVMGALDFAFAAIGLALLYHLKRNKQHVELVSSIALSLSFVMFYAIYLLAPYQTNRLSLFFLLSAAALFLKGLRVGLLWLLFIIAAIVAGNAIPAFDTGYSGIDIVSTCLYLIALFLIFWNYETVKAEQYKKERDLELQRRIDAKWRLALEGVGDAIWEWDIRRNRFEHSRSYSEMLGYGEQELGDTADHLERLLHPGDKAAANARLASYLNGEPAGQYLSEQRMRCKDGSYKWILCRGQVTQRDEAGRPQRMVGTHVDITERKSIQEEILSSRRMLDDERSLFQAILDNAPLGIWMVDAAGKVQFINQVFCSVTGISRAQFLAAAHFADLLPQPAGGRHRQSDAECLQQEAPHVSHEWLSFIDGHEHLLEITKIRLLHQDGTARGLVGFAADVTESKEHEEQLEHTAHYDALTGIPNRVLLADRLSQALARTRRDKGMAAVCYLDLDGFKPINDNYGHETGDKVLVEVTRRIKLSIRGDDTVARLGGDEFVVLLVGLQAPEECVGSLNRLLEAIGQPIEVQGKSMSVTASIGVALYPEDQQEPDALLRHADQAMYVAKQSGKNRYHFFDAANDLRARSHHEVLQQIRHGLAHGEFELYYQPKVEMATRRMMGVEALIRWHHPTRGFLLPGEFLRIIENTELEIELGDWVIASALQRLRAWKQDGQDFEVSINISAYHLQSPEFAEKLRAGMESCQLSNTGHRLQIEVLETAALDDIARVGKIIKACREFGVGFALDDFGTGYSSLSYLSNLDVDTLKIDQSFVRDMLQEKGDHAIVQGIIALARAFDRSVVAEGVETEELYRVLLQMGCAVGQGFGIARPMPAAELARWLAASKPA